MALVAEMLQLPGMRVTSFVEDLSAATAAVDCCVRAVLVGGAKRTFPPMVHLEMGICGHQRRLRHVIGLFWGGGENNIQ